MKFQAELVNFQDQLENRVLCKTLPSRLNSEVQPSVTKHEEFKMHLIDIITNIYFAPISCKQCKYNYFYVAKHETLLVMAIIDSQGCQLSRIWSDSHAFHLLLTHSRN